MFWNNTNYKWVRRRIGGVWLQVTSYLDASGGMRYWINREPFHHETLVHHIEQHAEKTVITKKRGKSDRCPPAY